MLLYLLAALAERVRDRSRVHQRGNGICQQEIRPRAWHCCGTPEEMAARIVRAWIRGGALAAIADGLNYDGYAMSGGNAQVSRPIRRRGCEVAARRLRRCLLINPPYPAFRGALLMTVVARQRGRWSGAAILVVPIGRLVV